MLQTDPHLRLFFRHRWKLLVARTLCASVLALQGCGVDAATTGVTVTPIGYDPSSHDPSIAWIDNDQLIFAGQKSNTDPKKVSFAPGKIYIWSETSKTARVYSEESGLGLCFSQGRISFIVGRDNEKRRVTFVQGMLGSEKRVERSSIMEGELFSNFDCKFRKRDEFVPRFPREREHLVLREGDGYLTLRPDDINEYRSYPRNITLYREKNALPVTLPITWDEGAGSWGTAYSDYLKAYVIQPVNLVPAKGPGNWAPEEPRVVYLLHAASGQVERLVFPRSDDFAQPRPTKNGWIYIGGNIYKTYGLYEYKNNTVRKLDVGNVKKIVVSPDGCKAAVAINNLHLSAPSPPTSIKIFNFCTERK